MLVARGGIGVRHGSDSDTPSRRLLSWDMQRRADQGWIEVIAGPMFSGKSEELIRRVTRYHLARIPTQTFKPALDTRYAVGEVVSHSRLSTEAQPVADSQALLASVADRTVVVGIDEGQFFDDGLVEVAELLAGAGKNLIIAGLDLDYLGRPFDPIPALMLRAEYVTKALAVCHRCGGPGLFTQRVVQSDELVVLGATDAYEARCRRCYDPSEASQQRLDVAAAE
jgi:thymidine kinase